VHNYDGIGILYSSEKETLFIEVYYARYSTVSRKVLDDELGRLPVKKQNVCLKVVSREMDPAEIRLIR
jgi:hypothetical protein